MVGTYNGAVVRKYKKHWNELTGWQRMDLQGRVKQVMQTRYSAHMEKGQLVQGEFEMDNDEGLQNFVVSFNEQGIIICEETFGSHGSTKDHFRDTGEQVLSEGFDIEGRLTDKREYRYEGPVFIELISTDGNGKQKSRVTNKYNEQGKISETLSFGRDPEELRSRRVFTYDEKGNMIDQIEYDEKDCVRCHSERRYNDKGLLIYRSTEWSKPEMMRLNKREELIYNDHGDCIQVDDFDLEGNHKETHCYKHEYDSNGKRILPNDTEDEKVSGQ
jgi:hypothetical protein